MNAKKLLTYLLVLSLALPSTLATIPLHVHAEEIAEEVSNDDNSTTEEILDDVSSDTDELDNTYVETEEETETDTDDNSNVPDEDTQVEEKTQEDEVTEVHKPDTSYTRDPATGHISLPLDETPYEEGELVTPQASALYASVPSSYHPYSIVSTMYPPTRNQNPYGSCWSFSAVGCAEFDLITEGIYANNGIPNFSELQLAYNMYHPGNDLLGNLDGDSCTLASNATKHFLNVGGNVTYAQHILANWKGLTHEDNIPYSNASSVLSYGLANSTFTWNNMARLENTRLLDIKSNPTSVKQAIMEHGAVAASYYHDSSYYTSSNGYALYYCPYNYTTNHAICIVGWDDNFSAYNWPSGKRPSRNGAWLIRNSWTTTTTGSEYSYFWMSYDDLSLAKGVWSMDYAAGDNIRVSSYNYDSIYQHDGTPTHGWISAHKASSIYTARNYYASSKGSKSETLEAVMLTFMNDTNVNLKIEIYTGLTNRSNPESGSLQAQATTTFVTDYKGIYTIPLRNPVPLIPGQTYSIVVTALDGSADFDIESSSTASGWFTTKASVDANENFFKSYSTSSWTDVVNYASSGFGNLCIKGLTKNCSSAVYTINYVMNGGTKTADLPTTYSSNSGTITLPTPTRSGYHFLGWYTDSSFTNKITSISGSTGRNLTLYARWSAHSYTSKITPATLTANGTIKQICSCGHVKSTSTIYRPSTSDIKLSYTKTYSNGSAKTPTVTVKDTAGKTLTKNTDYKVTYYNNIDPGTATVVIQFINKYSGSYTKTFLIEKPRLEFTKVTLSSSSYIYNGKYRKPTVTVYKGKTKVSTKYYTVSYTDNKDVGTATVTVTGKSKYAGYVNTKTFTIKPKAFTKATISSSSYAYTGSAVKPIVKVYVGKTKLSSSYYTVTYSNNVSIGKATITITGKDKYANYKSTKTFKIVPPKQVIYEVTTKGNRGYIYGYHRYDSFCTGYQTQLSTSKSFKKVQLTCKGPEPKYNAWTFYNLKSKKTFYIRTRSYKKVNGVTYYGAWSAVKSIKTK